MIHLLVFENELILLFLGYTYPFWYITLFFVFFNYVFGMDRNCFQGKREGVGSIVVSCCWTKWATSRSLWCWVDVRLSICLSGYDVCVMSLCCLSSHLFVLWCVCVMSLCCLSSHLFVLWCVCVWCHCVVCLAICLSYDVCVWCHCVVCLAICLSYDVCVMSLCCLSSHLFVLWCVCDVTVLSV